MTVQYGIEGGSRPFLHNFKDSRTVHRLLIQPTNFVRYYEHTVHRRAHPCIKNAVPSGFCPGCAWTGYAAGLEGEEAVKELERGQKGSAKFIVPVMLPVDGQPTENVVLWKYGVKLKQQLEEIGKGADLTALDTVIVKSGAKLSTIYTPQPGRMYPVDVEALRAKAPAWNEVLDRMFKEVWGDPLNPNREPAPPFVSKAEAEAEAALRAEQDAGWTPDMAPDYVAAQAAQGPVTQKPVDDPWATSAAPPAADPWAAGADQRAASVQAPAHQLTLTVPEVHAMTRAQLRGAFMRLNIPFEDDSSDEDLKAFLIANHTDAPPF